MAEAANQNSAASNSAGNEDNRSAQGGASRNGASGNGAAGASAAQGWWSTLPADVQVDDVKRYKTLETFTRGYLGLSKKLGSAVALPGPEATDEERGEFYTKLGRPESGDKYKIDIPKDTPVDEGFVKGAREAMFGLGLSGQQAEGMGKFFIEATQAALKAEGERIEAGVTGLKSEWGHGFDANLAVAGRAMDQFCEGEYKIEGLEELREDPRFGSNPVVLKLFHFLGTLMGEDKSHEGEERITEQDRAELEQKLANMMDPKKDPRYSGDHPQHKKWLAEKSAIFQELHGEGGAA